MPNEEHHIQRIKSKLQQLLKLQATLKKDNSRLTEELAAAQQTISSSQLSIEELKQQVSILKTGADTLKPNEKKEFEKRLNFYLKEIDRCIGLLRN